MTQTRDDIIEMFSRHVSPGKVDTYNEYDVLLLPGEREGGRISDIDGRQYINCHCNGGVFNLGHRNRAIIEAVKNAMAVFDIGNHHLVSRPKALLAKQLADTLPKDLDQVVYGVSGGEAVDLAIKLARGVTQKQEIISAKGGYHGHTGFALAAGDPKFKEIFKPIPAGFKQVAFNDIEEMKRAISRNTAAVILETIPATLGIAVPQKTYLKQVKALCREEGALLILEEIQNGFGRTGKFWGFEHFEVEPDMITLGKGMSGGIYPISATIYNKKYTDFFREDPFLHVSTFGGSEIGCYAAMEVIRITGEDGFLENVMHMGGFFREHLGRLGRTYPNLGLKVRGMGLMMGLEFKDEATALFLVKLFFDNGLYVVYSGNDPKVIQFLPVLMITENEAGEILERIETSFNGME